MEAIVSRQVELTNAIMGHAKEATPYDQLKAAIADVHPPTAEHSIRVRIYATSIGLTWGLSGRELTNLAIAAEIHDIGKLYVPIAILDKPGPLTDKEWAVIKKHPGWGAELLEGVFPGQPEIAFCVGHHHERLDGSGYPGKLREHQLPVLCRILAVADAYASLTEDRSYRAAFGSRDAMGVLRYVEEGKYDKNVLDALASVQISLHSERSFRFNPNTNFTFEPVPAIVESWRWLN